MTKLGKINVVKENKITAKEKFLISEQGYTTESYWVVLNVRYYWNLGLANYSCPNHIICIANYFIHLPKFPSKTQRIQVGNGQYVSAFFVIPIIVHIHGHTFQVHTLVSEIHENVDLVLGIKNVFQLEGVINS